MSNKKRYIEFCKSNNGQIPIFYQPYWLDIVVKKDNWDVVLFEDKGIVQGVLPYCHKTKLGFKKTFVPHFTAYHGALLFYPENQSEYKRRSFEKKAIAALLKKMPQFDDVRQKLHFSLDNWLPFRWNGFKQTTVYTYLIKDTSNTEQLFKAFKPSVQRHIRNNSAPLKVSATNDIKSIIDAMQRVSEMKGLKNVPPSELLERLFKICNEQDAATILQARNKNQEVIASILLVWDNQFMYYLFGGANQKVKDVPAGAMNILFWHAIQLASSKGIGFDFEGSQISNLEQFYRSFGATLTPCHFVWKTNSKLLKLREVGN